MNKNKKMPTIVFAMMTGIFRILDLLHSPEQKLDDFNIRVGETIVDYGCGPGRYLKKASELVGNSGKIYAADIHPSALHHVKNKIKRQDLKNVFPILIENDQSEIPEKSVDKIYALDMFHHVRDAKSFFLDLYRMIKPTGKLYLEDGHQLRATSLAKIRQSGCWKIEELNKNIMTLIPV